MRWLFQAIGCYAVLFILLGYLVFSRTWMAFGLLLLFVIICGSFLSHTITLTQQVVWLATHKSPGDWTSLIRFAPIAFNTSPYRLIEHGVWPKSPVIFIANYPSEVIEYWYFAHVASKCPLTVLARGPLPQHGGLRAHFMRCHFQDGVNHIHVASQKDSFDDIRLKIMRQIQGGRCIYTYAEKNADYHKPFYILSPLRTGLFRIAAKLSIPIVALAWSHMGTWSRNIHVCISPPMNGTAEDVYRKTVLFFDSQLSRLAFLDLTNG